MLLAYLLPESSFLPGHILGTKFSSVSLVHLLGTLSFFIYLLFCLTKQFSSCLPTAHWVQLLHGRTVDAYVCIKLMNIKFQLEGISSRDLLYNMVTIVNNNALCT